MDERYAAYKDFFKQPLSIEEKKRIWLEVNDFSEAQLDEMRDFNRERLSRAPKLGDPAPDFELERLGPNRKGTGEYVKLSALCGKPVALVFGAYT
jgi:hypothetical protein